MRPILSPSAGALLVLLLSNPAADAQEGAGSPQPLATPSVLEVLSACPRGGKPDDIVVCGRRTNDRYRLPLQDQGFDPDGPQESVARERGRLLEGGESGIGSCSTAGGGGWTGCFAQEVKRRQQQRAGR
jgi:hypothetical protein